jgi:hypothetical protein
MDSTIGETFDAILYFEPFKEPGFNSENNDKTTITTTKKLLLNNQNLEFNNNNNDDDDEFSILESKSKTASDLVALCLVILTSFISILTFILMVFFKYNES